MKINFKRICFRLLACFLHMMWPAQKAVLYDLGPKND